MFSNTIGIKNTAIGQNSFVSNTTGSNNTSVGFFALNANTTGVGNTSLGSRALSSNSTGDYNTATGFEALINNDAGGNTANGYYSLRSNTTGMANTGIGSTALYTNSTGVGNTAVGQSALFYNVGGSNNTAVGYNSFQAGADYSNSTAIGYDVFISADNQVRLGDFAITSIGGQVGWTTLSDERLKKNIQPSNFGLDFILKLKPVTYNYKAEGQKGILYTGFIAQDVEKFAKEIGYDFSGVDTPKNENDFYGLRYAEFVAPLTKATQELNAKVEAQQEMIKALQQEIEALKKK